MLICKGGQRGVQGEIPSSPPSPGGVGGITPSHWRRLTVVLAFVALGLSAYGGCQIDRSTPSASPGQTRQHLGRKLERPTKDLASKAAGVTLNRITYVSPEGNLFTVKPDGSDTQRLTGEIQARSTGGFMAQSLDFSNVYTWPTWSPDGSKLAASRLQVSAGQAEVSIQVIDIATGRARTIYQNDPSVFTLVAQTAPHYLYWSPNNHSLAFVAATAEGLTLFVADTADPANQVAVQTGAPIYFHWAGDGNSILLHAGADVKLAQKPFTTASRGLAHDTIGFRAPALSPDGHLLAYSVASPAGGFLIVAETANPSAARAVLQVGALSAFMWSPDGAELAVVDQRDPNSAIFQRLRVVSWDGSSARTIIEEPVLAFYWSPNGERIAWVALNREEQAFDWKVAPSSGEPVRQLFRFQPSNEVLTMLSFFDQFAYSHSPWSPNSSQLVVAGTLVPTFSRRNGQAPTGDRIFILDVAGASTPRDIAPGTLAFWSWN